VKQLGRLLGSSRENMTETTIVILCFYGCTGKTSTNLQASQGSAIVGIVTPDALYLFTDFSF
jgi:hypothetical protein